jgi:competence protein ComEA
MFKNIAVLVAAIGFAGLAWAQTDLNQATEIELDGLNGLGPGITRQILSERSKGAFHDWADVMRRVKGIGPQKARKLSDQGLRVQGHAYGPNPPPPGTAR